MFKVARVPATRGGRAAGRARACRAAARGCVLACLGLASSAAADPAPPNEVAGLAFGGTGETVFEHTVASLRDPHFGVRFYVESKVPGTLSSVSDPASPDADARAAAKGGHHVFMDAAFGERAPLVGWYDVHPTRSVRHARGVQLNAEAAAYLLLDFDAQSQAVIDTDYRIGLALDVRPWLNGLDRLSLSVGAYHQSSHLGDEYVLSAHTIQAGLPPEINPFLPYRANPSYYAFPITLSIDLGPADWPQYAMRLYGGATLYTDSQIPQATHPDERVGLELRFGPPAPTGVPEPASTGAAAPASGGAQWPLLSGAREFGIGAGALGTAGLAAARGTHGRKLRRGARTWMLAYEALLQRQYFHDPAAPGRPVFILGSGHWLTHHAMAILLFNLDTLRSTSNALAISIEFIDGRNQRGQLIEYDTIRTGALAVSYYW
jgi:hypothetical protein